MRTSSAASKARDAAVAEAAAAGVERILTIGREQAVELAARHRRRVGDRRLAPARGRRGRRGRACAPLLTRPRVVALGEVGLDFYRNNAPPDDQRRVFAAQIELANELGLPLVIHTRDADHETFPMLERARVPVVLHCFSSPQRLDEAVRARLPAVVRRQRHLPQGRVELQQAAARVPDDLLLAETDSPYLAPVPLRGRPNSPANVLHTLAFLAGLRGVDAASLGALIERNAARVFGLP